MLAYNSLNIDGLLQEFWSPKVPMSQNVMAMFALMGLLPAPRSLSVCRPRGQGPRAGCVIGRRAQRPDIAGGGLG